MDSTQGHAVQGGGYGATAPGPAPLTLDTSRAHKNRARSTTAPADAGVLTAAAKAKPQAKTSAAEQAIRALVKRGEPITFQAVCREAGVSDAFLYAHQTCAPASSTCAHRFAPP